MAPKSDTWKAVNGITKTRSLKVIVVKEDRKVLGVGVGWEGAVPEL